MRIVYYLPDIDAGVSRIVKNLLAFRKKDTATKYAVVLCRRDDQVEKEAGKDFDCDELIFFPYNKDENAFTIFRRLQKTLIDPSDIIVGNDGFEIKMVVTMKIPNPVVYIVHGDFPYYYSIIRNYHTVINLIICYSNEIDKQTRKIVGSCDTLVEKIYYPASLVEGKRRSDFHVTQPFRILFAGLTIQRKGADLLPAIYEGLHNRYGNKFEMNIAGEGELLPMLVKRLGKKENVNLLGWLDDQELKKEMKSADVFLFPSRLEGLPNVLVEALACGAVPVVTKLESGVTDFLADDYNSLLVSKDSIEGFVDAISKLYEQPSLLLKLQKQSDSALQIFEPVKQASLYETSIKRAGDYSYQKTRVFPSYRKGRVLDVPWLPGFLVQTVRKIVRNPKI